jgi:hypothetical protein
MKMMMKRMKMMKRERKERAVRHRVAATLYSKCSSTLRWLLRTLKMKREGRLRLTLVSCCGRACSPRERSLGLSSRYCTVLHCTSLTSTISHTEVCLSLSLFLCYSISISLFLSLFSCYFVSISLCCLCSVSSLALSVCLSIR